MEDYDRFVAYHLSQIEKNEEKNSNRHMFASAIRFYGQPILPPLLSERKREEMQQHRDEALKAAEHTKLKDNPRMAYVQSILHSVQLRKMPTLEDFFKESEICLKLSSCKSNSGPVSQSVFSKECRVSSPPSDEKEKDIVSLPPLTSTTCSAFFTSHIKSHLSNCEGSLINQHDNQQGSLPSPFNDASHQSISSGYMTYENVENAITVSGQIDTRSDSHDFVCTERSEIMGGSVLHNTSDTIAKMPDIISYPPVDGQELENSGLELTICNHLIAGDMVNDACCTLFQDNSITCTHLPVKKSTRFSDFAESKESTVFSTILDHNLDRNDSPCSLLKNCEVTDSLSMDNYPLAELHIQPGEAKPADNPEDETDSKVSEKPYRPSLQALLKKSQEYRRHQRMLRIQAKNTKIQERTQDQPKVKVEEHSLSDKENDQYSNTGTVTAEQKKSKDRRDTFIPTGVEMSLKKKSREKSQSEEILVRPGFTFESTEHFDIITSAEQETDSRNITLQPTEFNDIRSLPPQESTWTVNTHLAPPFKVTGKCHTNPVPSLCRSPVHCKVKSSSTPAEEATGETLLITCETNVDQKVEEGKQSSPTTAPSAVNVVLESDVKSVLATNALHLDQLEFNLSGLKVVISDLKTTITENMDKNCSQSESSLQSDTCCESGQLVELGHSDFIHGEEEEDYNEDDSSDKNREVLVTQSLDSCKNVCEDKSIYHSDELPVVEQDIQMEVISLRETMLVKTITTEREKESSTVTEPTESCGEDGSKQQPSGKCVLSPAQLMRIPDIFRTSSSETTAPRNLCVLSDTSNHLVQRNEADLERHDATHSPSLNQSYDVDAPSQLWLQEGSGSDSKGHLIPEKHLTPKNGVEDQSGLFKVKRKLLMPVSEDTAKQEGNISRIPRPTSSTPKAAAWRHEGHGSRREKQLKQVHAIQVRALQEQHRREQEELMQAFAVHYRLLQSVSFPCSMSTSHHGNMLTFPPISQPSPPRSVSSVPEHYRPLLVAAVKGFLTRRLMRTERVTQLVRTIRDTWQFLQAFSRGELCSRQDFLLQERVAQQLRAARYDVYDIFFNLSAKERMQLISWDRELTRERTLKQQSGYRHHLKGKSSLSAATQKSLERKRGIMIQKKAVERHKGTATETGQRSRVSAEQPLKTRRGQFRANPPRVPRNTYSSKPR